MRAAHSWLGPDGQCASIAGSRGVFCEKGLHGPVAADPQGDSYVQQLACEEDRPFSRYLLNPAGRDCAAADAQKPESALRTSIGRTLVRADRRRKPPSSRSARGPDRAEPNVRFEVRLHAGFPSGRLTSSNVGTWVVPNQDSSVVPQT